MKIDAHNHFWKYDPVRDAWIGEGMEAIKRDFFPEDFAPVLAENGMDGCIAVQADQSENETQFLLDLANDHDFIKGVVGWIDLQADDIDSRLEKFESLHLLKGFRHIAQAEANDFLVSDKFLKGIASLSKTDFTYDILVFPPQLSAAVELVNRFPQQAFVLDHIAKPYIKKGAIDIWKKHIEKLATYEHVYCKLSGLVTEANWTNWAPEDFIPYLDVVVESFGIDRIMFGSDYPVCLIAASYGEVLGIIEGYFDSFSAGEKEKIFGKNATHFYKID